MLVLVAGTKLETEAIKQRVKEKLSEMGLKLSEARVMSDRDQRYTAKAICKECHIEVHGGSFNPTKRKSSWNAGYAERCSPSVGTAS